MTDTLRDAAIRGLLTGDPATRMADRPGDVLDQYTAPQYLPDEMALRALDASLDAYFARRVASSQSCGAVETRYRASQGCDCTSCSIWREKAAANRRRLREAARQQPGRIALSRHEKRELRQLWADHDIDPRACVYCGSRSRQVVDHFLPVHLGGASKAINLLPACWDCNAAKAAKEPWAWMMASCPERIPHVMDYVMAV